MQRPIGSLPPKYRVPLTMFHLDGLSYGKVATFLDIPLGTAKSLIHRARAKLKDALTPYLTEEIMPAVQEVFDEHKLRPEFAERVLQASALATYPPEYRVQIENTPIPGVLRALMEFIGEDFGYSLSEGAGSVWRSNAAFELFTGVWGDAFDFVWLPKAGAGRTPAPTRETPPSGSPPRWTRPGSTARRSSSLTRSGGSRREASLTRGLSDDASSPPSPTTGGR